MQIWHRIAINSNKDKDFCKTILKYGIQFMEQPLLGEKSKLIVFDIHENDQYWPLIAKMVDRYGASDMVETFFSEDEIRSAEWSRMISTFEQGYPQPKLHWPLKQLSYVILCPKCTVRRQIGPLRVAKEPSLRTKSFMSLIWTTDILCVPEVVQGLNTFQVVGFEPWDVLIHKTNTPSEKIKQLYITNTVDCGLVIDHSHKIIECPECGTVKYYPHVRGKMKMKQEAVVDSVDFLLTAEWFGHGFLAWKEILVSRRVANFILDKGWKGVRFKVVEIV